MFDAGPGAGVYVCVRERVSTYNCVFSGTIVGTL